MQGTNPDGPAIKLVLNYDSRSEINIEISNEMTILSI